MPSAGSIDTFTTWPHGLEKLEGPATSKQYLPAQSVYHGDNSSLGHTVY
jgi:hypothetical protein